MRSQITVALMDDEYAALLTQAQLIERSDHLQLVATCSTPDDLLTNASAADVILVDVEFRQQDWSLTGLLTQLQHVAPDSRLLCLSQYSEPETVHTALQARVDGFLHKSDVGYGLPTAIRMLMACSFLYSAEIAPLLRRHHPTLIQTGHKLPTWQLPFTLTKRLKLVAEQVLLLGINQKTLADRWMISKPAMHTYTSNMRQAVRIAYELGFYQDQWLPTERRNAPNNDQTLYTILTLFPNSRYTKNSGG